MRETHQVISHSASRTSAMISLTSLSSSHVTSPAILQPRALLRTWTQATPEHESGCSQGQRRQSTNLPVCFYPHSDQQTAAAQGRARRGGTPTHTRQRSSKLNKSGRWAARAQGETAGIGRRRLAPEP
jgi:hypothetical protein